MISTIAYTGLTATIALSAALLAALIKQKRRNRELMSADEERGRIVTSLYKRNVELPLTIENAGLGSFEWDIPRNKIRCSPAYLGILGLQPDSPELTYEEWKTLVHPEDRERIEREILGPLLASKISSYSCSLRLKNCDGTWRFISSVGRIIEGPGDGGSRRLIGVIAEQPASAFQSELTRQQAQSLQSLKLESIGRLAGGIAHDFNNLLTTILGYSEMTLKRADLLPPKLKDNVSRILKAAEHARVLTGHLLAFGRKQVLQMRAVDLNQVVHDFSQLLSRLIEEGIDLEERYSSHLAPIKADPVQLEQILMNLCLNARDAMPDGGELTIETESVILHSPVPVCDGVVPSGEYSVLRVSDNGCGMSPEALQHLFEPFYSTKEKKQGSGLGLAIVYGIVKQHGAYISVQSTSQAGTVFSVYFPAERNAFSELEQQRENIFQEASPTGMVLLVEDDSSVRTLTREILEEKGYSVLEAATPADALHLAGENSSKLDILLTDVILPQMNGKTVYEKVFSLCPKIKVLFMSGYTDEIVAPKGVLTEGFQFIQKPFTPEALASKIREVMLNGNARH